MGGMGRFLIVFGLLLVAVGLVFELGGRWFPIGRLPGDIVVERPHFRFYFPLATSLLVSLLLTGLFWLLAALRR
ncbi:MAG TPA: DUF2905 domain-containing protein [Firmicutes bacterium]|nr:DUF2905 domain-containing protein [Bacillota bacterium]